MSDDFGVGFVIGMVVTGLCLGLLFGLVDSGKYPVRYNVLNELCADKEGTDYMFSHIKHFTPSREDGLNSQIVCKQRPTTPTNYTITKKGDL